MRENVRVMDTAGQPAHSPLLAGLLLPAGAAFWAGIALVAGGGNAFGRSLIGAIIVLSLAGLASLPFPAGRATGETVVWALLGVEVALALLTFFSLLIFGWIPVALTVLAIVWWPRHPSGRALTPLRLTVQILAFLAALAPLVVPV